MAENSKIEWTDHTFNPWTGCAKISPGCDHCYAESWAKRSGAVKWGAGEPRRRTTAANWQQPHKWNRQAQAEGRRYRVFCASLADVFDNSVDPQWRADLFTLISQTPNLDWLLLTKRIGNAHEMIGVSLIRLADGKTDLLPSWPWPNVWLGATIVNQEEADRDIPKLLATPAHVRFLSMEPLLAPVILNHEWLGWKCCVIGARAGSPNACNDCDPCIGAAGKRWVDWVIVGGESGPKARPLHVDWPRSIVQQCRAAGVPVLVKQLGRAVLDSGMSSPGEHWPMTTVREPLPRVTEADAPFVIHMRDPKGGDMAEWPEDLRVRQFPEVA